MMLSVIIPAYNEAGNIEACITAIKSRLDIEPDISYELICVNDNSTDETPAIVLRESAKDPRIRLVGRTPPGGFGRAIRSGIAIAKGDAIAIFMADLSDRPDDLVRCYRKLQEGYDCVFGSRFIKGSEVKNYPRVKLLINRVVNKLVQVMFWTQFNDLTNAFKIYRATVLENCGPYRACHFNITLELSLSALIRQYDIAQLPISWEGRTWGCSNLRLKEMGRKYLCTLLMIYFEKLLIRDDILAEKVAKKNLAIQKQESLEKRLEKLESVTDGRLPKS